MKSLKHVVLFATAYLIAFTILSTIKEVPIRLLIGMFSCSPFIVLYLTFRVLMVDSVITLTFEDVFYEDFSYQRISFEDIEKKEDEN